MTTCVHPTNSIPGTIPYGATGFYPGILGTNPFAGPTLPHAQPNFIQPFTGFSNCQQFPVNQFPVNTVPFNGFPAPQPSGFAGATPWTNPYAFTPAPWSNGYPISNPYAPTPTWNPWSAGTFNAFNPASQFSTSSATPTFFSPCPTTQVNGWNTPTFPGTSPFNFVPNTPWQTPWTTGFNSLPTTNFNTNPFIGGYTPTQFAPNFVNPLTTGWQSLAAAISTLSQPANWSALSTTPATTPWGNFNPAPFAGVFPTFGSYNPSGFNPVSFPQNVATPAANFLPFFNTQPNTPFGYPGFFPGCLPGFPTGFTNSPWNAGTPNFNGFNPMNAAPFFQNQIANQGTPGFTPGVPTNFTPGAPTNGIPATRTNVQNNGDGSYRSAT